MGKGVTKNSLLDSAPGHTDVNTVYFYRFSWLPQHLHLKGNKS